MPVKVLNVPNMLSISRIILAPFVMAFLVGKSGAGVAWLQRFGLDLSYGDLFAGVIFVVAALTDTADGYLARKHGQVTNLGKFIDPLSDKVLIMAALLALVELHRVPGWMVLVIVSRDFIVSGLRMVAAIQGSVIAASKLGKLKTVVQVVAIVMIILNLPYAMWAMWFALILTVVSGVEYMANGWHLITDEN